MTHIDDSDRIDAVWCCPQCRGQLAQTSQDSVQCRNCRKLYPVFDGIADLRLEGVSWIDQDEDRLAARKMIVDTRGMRGEDVVRYVFALNPEFTSRDVEVRTRQVMLGIERLQTETDGWLKPCISRQGIALDLGCGPGQIIAASASKGLVIGVDVRLLWLLAAKRLILENGGRPVLAAGMAEALPLADGSIDGVISLDVIEHVADVPTYLKEINRVTAPGGSVALSTPNRYSLAAEPHVGVWGVGWVPRRYQAQFVKWRSGKNYPSTCLLGVNETVRLFVAHTDIKPKMIVPTVAEHEIERFPVYRKVLARIYNALSPHGMFRGPLLAVGPFFRVLGRKKGRKQNAQATSGSKVAVAAPQ